MNQTSVRADKLRARAYEMRRRVRFARRQIERISRTATLGGLFLSFLKIGLVGFGGGVAVLAQIRTLTVRKRFWLTDSEFAEALIHTWVGFSIMIVAIFTLVRFRPNAFWVILGAGVIRLLFGALGLG